VTGPVIALAGALGFLLAALAASLLCLARVRTVLRALPQTSASEAALEVLQEKLESLEREVRELPALASVSAPSGLPAAPRAALNLEKRSHAIRLHRRGEPPARIASALELPQQEVELLIKVHRIVLKNL
jgi:hypothetical protein